MMHEIYDSNKAKDKAKQFTLTHFYEHKIPLKLDIFIVSSAKQIEKDLLNAHNEKFGYLPIANRKIEK